MELCFLLFCARTGNLKILKWLYKNNIIQCWNIDRKDCCGLLQLNAAVSGNKEMLLWLREKGIGWTSQMCAEVASSGNLELLAWLRDESIHGPETDEYSIQGVCHWDDNTGNWAASRGRIEILAWILENGGELNSYTCGHAAEFGELEMLKWLRSKGCPWDEKTCLWSKDYCFQPHIQEFIHRLSIEESPCSCPRIPS
jgi:hypothetical protein